MATKKRKPAAAKRRKPRGRSPLREWLHERALENDVVLKVLEPATLDAAAMGITDDGQHVVYSYDRLVLATAAEGRMSWEDAAEYVDYNTVRSLPYMQPNEPVIVHEIPDDCRPAGKRRG